MAATEERKIEQLNVEEAIGWMKSNFTGVDMDSIETRMRKYHVNGAALYGMEKDDLKELVGEINKFHVASFFKAIHAAAAGRPDTDVENMRLRIAELELEKERIALQRAQVESKQVEEMDVDIDLPSILANDSTWEGKMLRLFLPRGAVVIKLARSPLQQDRLDRYSKKLTGVVPSGYIYYYTFGGFVPLDFRRGFANNTTFMQDVLESLNSTGVAIEAQFKQYGNFQVALSMTTDIRLNQIVGSPSHRFEKYSERGRVKHVDFGKITQFLGIAIGRWGKVGDEWQACLKDNESTTQSLFNALIEKNRGVPLQQPPLPNFPPDTSLTQHGQVSRDPPPHDWETIEIVRILNHKDEDDHREYLVEWSRDLQPSWESQLIPQWIVDWYENNHNTDHQDHLPENVGSNMKMWNSSRSQQSDDWKSQPDLTVDVDVFGLQIAFRIELMGEANKHHTLYTIRTMDYAANLLEEEGRGFSIVLGVQGKSRFWIVLCYRKFGKPCWFITPRLKVESSTGMRFADVLLTLMTASPRTIGIFDRYLGSLKLCNVIGFGGEAIVFRASTENVITVKDRDNRTDIPVISSDAVGVAVKYWRTRENFEKFKNVWNVVKGFNDDDFFARHFMPADHILDEDNCVVMPLCVESVFCADADEWAHLARWLMEFHEKTKLVHCDLSPANILMTPSGHLVITDWGQAVTVNSPFSHQMTTLSIFPEAASRARAQFDQDLEMLLRSVAWVRYRQSNALHVLAEGGWPPDASLERRDIGVDEFCAKVRALCRPESVRAWSREY